MSNFFKVMKRKFSFFLLGGILLIIVAISTAYCSELKYHNDFIHPEAKKGTFDYSMLDLQERFTLLNGEIEFYWNQLLTPEDLNEAKRDTSLLYVNIPSAWNNLIWNDKKINAFGYGTYHFKIIVSKPGLYSLKIKEFESAFDLWINAKHYRGAGKVGTSKNTMEPCWKRRQYNFYTENTTIDIILQISNFQHRLGGASEPILFGSTNSIQKLTIMRVGSETFLIGLLLILLLYLLTLYVYRKEDKSILYYSLSCFFIFLRLVTTGEKLILDIFPFLSWNIAVRIEYIANVMIVPSLTLFFFHILPKSIPEWFKKSVLIISGLLVFTDICFPAYIVTCTIFLYISLCIYATIVTFVFIFRAALKKKENALILFLGFTLLSIVIFNDILVYTISIHSTYLLPFGLTILLFTQAFILSRNNSLAFVKVKELSIKLEFHAEELEELVMKRTKCLQKRKLEIEQQKEKIEKQTKILSKANKRLIELDSFKRDMTKMLIHDLKTPLNNILGFLQLPEITDDYKKLMQASGHDLLNLIHNILDITKYENTKIRANIQSVNLSKIVDAAYNLNKYAINRLNITFENLVTDDFFVPMDEDLIERVCVNIISNATKFRNENGLIRVSSEIIESENISFCKVKIFNTGETIPEDKIDTIYDSYKQVYSARGEYKYSTGIGLTFCKMAIEAHNGQIGVYSAENIGVTFWFTIPLIDNLK